MHRAFTLAVLVAGSASGQDWRTADASGYCALRTTSRYTATTASCLSCHDGSVVRAVELASTSSGASGHSHPVDVSYADAQHRRPGRLLPRAAVSRALWLPGGRVTCTTCHDGASTRPSRVVLGTGYSALCFGCHTV